MSPDNREALLKNTALSCKKKRNMCVAILQSQRLFSAFDRIESNFRNDQWRSFDKSSDTVDLSNWRHWTLRERFNSYRSKTLQVYFYTFILHLYIFALYLLASLFYSFRAVHTFIEVNSYLNKFAQKRDSANTCLVCIEFGKSRAQRPANCLPWCGIFAKADWSLSQKRPSGGELFRINRNLKWHSVSPIPAFILIAVADIVTDGTSFGWTRK